MRIDLYLHKNRPIINKKQTPQSHHCRSHIIEIDDIPENNDDQTQATTTATREFLLKTNKKIDYMLTTFHLQIVCPAMPLVLRTRDPRMPGPQVGRKRT